MKSVQKTQKKELFIKYINDDCTEEDIKQLIAYFKNSEDFSDVPTIEDTYQFLEGLSGMDESEVRSMHDTILEIAGREEKVVAKKRSMYWKYAAAASVLLIVALTIFLNKGDDAPQFLEPLIVNNQIKIGTDKATLTMENGEDVTLIKGASFQTPHATSNGEEIIYKAGERDNTEIAYNYLTIPRGGQYRIVLSDDTAVWINSESQLKYPVNFIEGKPREVELVYGEAYFEVSPSTEHGGTKFYVINKNQTIEVLGTKFNVKAYKEEPNIYTTLLEGKVSVNTKSWTKLLVPNNQSVFSLENNHLSIQDVDVKSEIAWIRGEFVFQKKSLKDIAKVLGRWYDVDFKFLNDSIANKHKFNGELKKNQNLETILKLIQNTNKIESYEMKGNTVFLK